MMLQLEDEVIGIGEGSTLTFTQNYYLSKMKSMGCDMRWYNPTTKVFLMGDDYFTQNID